MINSLFTIPDTITGEQYLYIVGALVLLLHLVTVVAKRRSAIAGLFFAVFLFSLYYFIATSSLISGKLSGKIFENITLGCFCISEWFYNYIHNPLVQIITNSVPSSAKDIVTNITKNEFCIFVPYLILSILTFAIFKKKKRKKKYEDYDD